MTCVYVCFDTGDADSNFELFEDKKMFAFIRLNV